MWPNPQQTADLVTFTEEIFHEKFHFLCSVPLYNKTQWSYFSEDTETRNVTSYPSLKTLSKPFQT